VGEVFFFSFSGEWLVSPLGNYGAPVIFFYPFEVTIATDEFSWLHSLLGLFFFHLVEAFLFLYLKSFHGE